MAIEIVDLHIENGGSFHSYVNVYQRVYIYMSGAYNKGIHVCWPLNPCSPINAAGLVVATEIAAAIWKSLTHSEQTTCGAYISSFKKNNNPNCTPKQLICPIFSHKIPNHMEFSWMIPNNVTVPSRKKKLICKIPVARVLPHILKKMAPMQTPSRSTVMNRPKTRPQGMSGVSDGFNCSKSAGRSNSSGIRRNWIRTK